MMMNLLKDKSKNIQFEAFHVFKVRPPPLHFLSLLPPSFFFFLLHLYGREEELMEEERIGLRSES